MVHVVMKMKETETTEVSKLRSFIQLQPVVDAPIPNTPYPTGLRRWLRVLDEADYIIQLDSYYDTIKRSSP